MKKLTSILFVAVAVLASCQKNIAPEKGVQMTISAAVFDPAASKTTYEYNSGSQAGTIAVSWEATEYVTVVSIGESGITAVDEFSSTGSAGRTKADFTGTWNGNEGDKVICLYPALTKGGSAGPGAAIFSGVTVGSSSITLNNLELAYSGSNVPVNDPNSIKNADVMVGEISISGTNASVMLNRQISVFRITVSAPDIWCDYPDYEYVKRIKLSALTPSSTPAVFATSASLSATKSSYTGEFVPVNFGTMAFGCDIRSASTLYTYYYPVLAKDELDSGYRIIVEGHSTWIDGGRVDARDFPDSKEITSRLHIYPGYVYALGGITF